MTQQQRAARQDQRKPVAKLAVKIKAQAQVSRAERNHADGGDERAKVPRENAGEEAQRQDEAKLGCKARLLDEAPEDQGIRRVPIAAGEIRLLLDRCGSVVLEVVAGGDGANDGQLVVPEVGQIIGLAQLPQALVQQEAVG